MKDLLKNKLFIIFALFIILVFSIFNTSSATFFSDSFEVNYNEQTYIITVPSEIDFSSVKYYFCINYGNGVFHTFCITNEDFNVVKFGDKKNGGTYYKYITICDEVGNVAGSSDNLGYYFTYNSSSGNYGAVQNLTGSGPFLASFLDNSVSILYSSQDIYNYSGDLVFQGAPQVTTQVEPMKIQQVEELALAVVKIVTPILPACLTVFGVLLVVYLIKSKNLLQV